MLSIKPIAQSKSAQHYYTSQDNYYLKDKENLKDLSNWVGLGAQKLNLSGVVEPETFLRLLNGKLPSGEELGITINGIKKHRAGTDLTFSAPKSISILGLVAQDKRIINAHNKAVSTAFERIEKMAAEARLTFSSKTVFEKTRNLTAATFLHTSSRELDPALHTHVVIMNMTERADGKWRALASRSKNDKENLDNGFREIIYNNQHYFGLIYTSTLAKEVKNLGFDIRIKDEFGNFEVEGISDNTINALSKRREQIVSNMQKKGFSGAKAAEKSNLDTRSLKSEIDSESLLKLWQTEIQSLGVNLNSLIDQSMSRVGEGKITLQNNEPLCKETKAAVSSALLHLSEYNSQIKHSTLVRQAMLFSLNTISHESIEHEIQDLIDNKKILGKPFDYYTTSELLEKEKTFINELKQKPVSLIVISDSDMGFAASILKNGHRIQIVDVNGLSNQKQFIQNLIDTSEKNKLNAYVLHQGKHKAQYLTGQLSHDSVGIFSFLKNLAKDELVHTVAGFCYKYGKTIKSSIFTHKRDDVIVIHDAQKLSYKDIQTINELTKNNNSKLILLNNTASTMGFSAGNPIKVLRDNGIACHQSSSKLKIFDVKLNISSQHTKDMVLDWALINKEKRDKITLVETTNKKIADITQDVRARLRDNGELSWHSKNIQVMSAVNFTPAQKKLHQTYMVDDRLTFKAFTKQQTHYDVVKIEKDALLLRNKYGDISRFNLNSSEKYILSRPKKLEFAIGDKLTNDRPFFYSKRKIEKGQNITILNINSDSITAEINGRKIYLDDSVLKDVYLSYNYCKKPQQLTANDNKIMMLVDSYKLNKNLFGEIGEFANEVSLYTNDEEKAKRLLEKEQIKYTATDIKNQLPSLVYRDIEKVSNAFERDLDGLINSFGVKDKEKIAQKAVSYALLKCSEKNAAFKHSDLLMHALKAGMGEIDFQDIAPILLEKIENGDLTYLNSYWTTKNALEVEKNILNNNKNEQNRIKPILEDKSQLLSLPDSLTKGQACAITLLTTTSDRFVSVQGLAGVGKTTMLKEVQNITNKNGFKLIGLAPTHKAVSELNKNSIKSFTVDSFLLNDSEIDEKTFLIVDESSMLNNTKYFQLQQKAIDSNARLAFVGDITQLQSLQSGIPHELTIKSRTQKVAFMEEIVRQNPNPDLKKAALLASNRKIGEALDTLKKINPEDYVERKDTINGINNSSFIEIDCSKGNEKDYAPIYKAIVNDYLSRTQKCQENTLIITPAHADRFILDKLIREGLKEQGSLSKDDYNIKKLIPINMDKADVYYAKNFSKGDIICFGKNYYIGRKREYFSVEEIDANNNKLRCANEKGELFTVKASILTNAQISLYKSSEKTLALGEKVRITKSDKTKGFIANEEFKIHKISNDAITLVNKEKELKIKPDDRACQHWDYAYTNTAYSSQGATSKYIIALELPKRALTTNHRSNEIIITRASHQATIYTDDAKSLINRFENYKLQKDHDKTSALYKKIENDINSKAHKEILKNVNPSENSSHKITSKVKNNSLAKKSSYEKNDANEILQNLNAQAENLAKSLLGEPNLKLSSKSELRYGNKGSLKVNLHNGLWHNFETGESGNLFSLIKCELGLTSFKETIDYAKKFTNHLPNYALSQKKPKIHDLSSQQNNMQKIANKLYKSSKPIEGTIAEKYLLMHRKVRNFENADIRYCPKVYTKLDDKTVYVPAMLSFSKNETGDINHVQVTRLDKMTADKNKTCGLIKQTYGSIGRCAINLNRVGQGETTYLTEGVETGLSLLEIDSTKRVFAVLGKANFAKIDENLITKKVYICIDNDGKDTFKLNKENSNSIIKAAERLEELGRDVSIIIPRDAGKDLNDILKEKGKIALENQLSQTLSLKAFLNKCQNLNDPEWKIKNIPISKNNLEYTLVQHNQNKLDKEREI